MKSRQDARRLEFTPSMAKLSENALAYPSVATDNAESKRVSQFFLNKTLNKASGLEEVSAHQHSAALKGQKSSFTTESFTCLNVGDAANQFLSLLMSSGSAGSITLEGSSSSKDRDSDHTSDHNNEHEHDQGSSCDESDADGEEDSGRHDNDGVVDESESTQREVPSPDTTNKQGSGLKLLIGRPGEFVLIRYFYNYLYRPVCLYAYNYDEFTITFDLRKKEEFDIGDGQTTLVIPPGSVGVFEFQNSHPASGTHYLKIRKRLRTPILQGQMPPPLRHWVAKGSKRKLFIRFYAFHSIPFWLPDGPQPDPARVGVQSAEHYLTPAAFSDLMSNWQKPSSPWLFRARYAKHKNMIHVQHTPHEARVTSAKNRYENVVPWKEWDSKDRPPSEIVSDAGAIPCDSESAAIERMLACVRRGASTANAPFKRLREEHRKHIVKTFHDVYPSPRHGPDDDATHGTSEGPVDPSPCLTRAVEQRCPWDAWGTKTASCFSQEAIPEEAESLQSETPSHWELHSMRGHLEADSILMCTTHKSYRIEIPPDLLLSDPSFPPSRFPTRPATLHLHSGFSSLASRAGVDLSSAKMTAEELLRKLQDHKAVVLATVPSGLALKEPASAMCLSSDGTLQLKAAGLDPSQLKAAETWRSAVRGLHVFARFLELAIVSDTPIVFSEGDRVLRSDLNPEQTTFYDRIITAASDDDHIFEPDNANNPKLHLLCGRAGTGKTYVTAAIQNHLELMGIRCAAIAFMWSAVYQMKVTCEKHSIHSFLGKSIDDLQPDRVAKMGMSNSRKLRKLKDRLEGIGALFVDEISTTAFHLLLALDKDLRSILNPDEPFGGILVILLGDFGQLPPVQGKSLAELAVISARRNAAGENRTGDTDLVEAEAARLFTSFRRMDLKHAMRSEKDPDWSDFTARFDPNFTEHPITPTDLATLKNMRLSAGLLAQRPCLEFAVAGVLTNFEAKIINDRQVVRFARRLDDPVFRTVSAVVCTGGFSEDATEGYIAMEAAACELEQLWVRGMPVVVSERPSAISPSYGIANGRQGFFHSFGFDDPAAAQGEWSDHPRHFNDGVVVKVPSPDYINVKFLFDKPKGKNLDEWSIVVPFRAKPSSEPMKVPPPPPPASCAQLLTP